MTTSTHNSWTSQLVTQPSLEAEMHKAKASHRNAKTHALETVVSLYGLYLATQGPNAPKQSQQWLSDKIEAANIAIDNQNKAKAKGEPRFMRIEARDKASNFTTLVKLILEVRDPKEASIVSRYCRALEAIDREFAGKPIGSPQEINTWSVAQGGFEALVKNGRGDSSTKKSDGDSWGEAAMAAVAAVVKEEANTRQSVAQFAAPQSAPDGLVIAIGRKKGGQIEIVNSSPLPDDNSWVSFFEKELGPILDPTTAFVSRVQSLGALVSEGRTTDRTVNGIPGARPLKEERVLTMIPTAVGTPMLMVSAQRAKASIIIKALPTDSSISLGAPVYPVSLKHDHEVALRATLGSRYASYMVNITAGTDGHGLPNWMTRPTKLSTVTSVQEHTWLPAVSLLDMPLDVGNLRADFAVDLAISDLVRLHDERLKVWVEKEKAAKASEKGATDPSAKKKQKADGPKKRISLKFDAGTLTYSMAHSDDLILPVTGSIRKAAELKFRPYDLLNVAATLRQQEAKSVRLEGDSRGLLKFSWADTLGSYDVYLPTANEGSGLETKLMDELRPEDPLALAA